MIDFKMCCFMLFYLYRVVRRQREVVNFVTPLHKVFIPVFLGTAQKVQKSTTKRGSYIPQLRKHRRAAQNRQHAQNS